MRLHKLLDSIDKAGVCTEEQKSTLRAARPGLVHRLNALNAQARDLTDLAKAEGLVTQARHLMELISRIDKYMEDNA